MLKGLFGGEPPKQKEKKGKSVSFREDLTTTSETADPPVGRRPAPPAHHDGDGPNLAPLSRDLLSGGSEPTLKKLRTVMTDTSALIPISQLELLVLIGEGNNDFVWKCKWSGPNAPASVGATGGLVALKQRKVVVRPHSGGSAASDKALGDRELAAFAKELLVLKSLSHPNIVAYMGATLLKAEDGHDEIAIVQEFAPYGTLRPLIYEQASVMRSFSVTDGVRWAHQIALGMTFLHSCTPPIIHRNLKPENILLGAPNGTAKIADFGLITFESESARKPAPTSAASEDQVSSSFGSLHYLAPEVYRGEGSTHKADVYSFGMLLFELLMRRPAFHGMLEGENVAHGAAHDALRPPMPHNWPLPVKQTVKRAWDPYPATRAEFETICEELERWLEPGSEILKKLISSSPKTPLEYLGHYSLFGKHNTDRNPGSG